MALFPAVAACVVDVETTSDLRVACGTDADCPTERICNLAGACVVAGDERGPALSGANALDASTVELTFDEALLPADAVDVRRYAMIPSLGLLGAELDSSGQRVRLSTAEQSGGVSYTVTADVRDAQGNTIRVDAAAATFSGFGEAPDPLPPRILAPADLELVVGTSIVLSWSRPRGASVVTVEVATDEDFSSAIPGSPWQVPSTEPQHLTVDSLAARTYYWRVRADTTSPGATSTSRVALTDDAVYVYCPSGSDCDGRNDAGEPEAVAGNPTHPLPNLGRALAMATLLDLPAVKVARRGPNIPYEEAVQLQGPVPSLLGGYDPTFAEASRDPEGQPTLLRGPGPVVEIGAVIPLGATFEISGWRIEATAGLLGGVLLLGATDAVTLRFVDIESTATAATNVAVQIFGGSSLGPLIEDSRITAVGGSDPSGIASSGGSLRLRRVEVTATASVANGEAQGISVSGSIDDLPRPNLSLEAVTLTVAGPSNSTTGLNLLDGASLTVTDLSLSVRSTLDDGPCDSSVCNAFGVIATGQSPGGPLDFVADGINGTIHGTSSAVGLDVRRANALATFDASGCNLAVGGPSALALATQAVGINFDAAGSARLVDSTVLIAHATYGTGFSIGQTTLPPTPGLNGVEVATLTAQLSNVEVGTGATFSKITDGRATLTATNLVMDLSSTTNATGLFVGGSFDGSLDAVTLTTTSASSRGLHVIGESAGAPRLTLTDLNVSTTGDGEALGAFIQEYTGASLGLSLTLGISGAALDATVTSASGAATGLAAQYAATLTLSGVSIAAAGPAAYAVTLSRPGLVATLTDVTATADAGPAGEAVGLLTDQMLPEERVDIGLQGGSFIATGGQATAVLVYGGTDLSGDGVFLEASSTGGGDQATGLRLTAGENTLTLTNSEVFASATDLAYGVQLDGPSDTDPQDRTLASLNGGVIAAAGAGTAVGVRIQHGVDANLSGVALRTDSDGARAVGIEVTGAGAEVFADALRIGVPGTADAQLGLAASGETTPLTTVWLTNSLVTVAPGANLTSAIQGINVDLRLIHNVLLISGGGGTDASVWVSGRSAWLINSIVGTLNGVATCLLDMDMTATGPRFVDTLYANVFTGCPTVYDSGGTQHTSVTSLEGMDGAASTVSGQHVRIGGNAAWTGAHSGLFVDLVGPDNDLFAPGDANPRLLRLNSPDNFWAQGHDTSLNDCGTDEVQHSCGDVDTDATPSGRTTPPSIGMYELD